MDALRPVTLDASGQPVFLAEEVSYRLQQRIDMYDRDKKLDDRRGGIGVVTSHRVIWIHGARTAAAGWHLADVERVGSEDGGLFVGSAKVVLHFAGAKYVKLSFKEGGRDAFFEDLQKALARKSWVTVDVKSLTVASVGGGSSAAGASGAASGGGGGGLGMAALIAAREQQQHRAASVASHALADIDELAKYARVLVKLAESYTAETARRSAAAAKGGEGGGAPASSPAGGDDDESAAAAAGEMALSVGILNAPVTRASAGKLYYQELARQIAGFLRPVLAARGGCLPLTDVWCLYNRARGTDLISPDDASEALALLPSLGLGMSRRRMPSGLLVVQLDSFSDEAVAARLVALLKERAAGSAPSASLASEPFLSASDLAAAWRIPLPLAASFLGVGEARGALARDDCLNGLRFYRNLF